MKMKTAKLATALLLVLCMSTIASATIDINGDHAGTWLVKGTGNNPDTVVATFVLHLEQIDSAVTGQFAWDCSTGVQGCYDGVEELTGTWLTTEIPQLELESEDIHGNSKNGYHVKFATNPNRPGLFDLQGTFTGGKVKNSYDYSNSKFFVEDSFEPLVEVAAIPEPTPVALMGIGLIAMGLTLRNKKIL